MDSDTIQDDPTVEVRLVGPAYIGEEYFVAGTELRVPKSMMDACTAMRPKDEDFEKPKMRDLSSKAMATQPPARVEVVSRVKPDPTERAQPLTLQAAGKAPKLTGHGTGKPKPPAPAAATTEEATLEECRTAASGVDMAALPADSLTPKGYMKKAVLEQLVGKPVSMPVFLDFMKQDPE
jgi:hypothetical protein